MSRFLDRLRTENLTPQDLRDLGLPMSQEVRELTADLRYESDLLGGVVAVLSGTVTDNNSVPRLIKWLIDDNDPRIIRGGVLHDHGYKNGGWRVGDGSGVFLKADQRLCDKVKMEADLSDGCPPWMARLIYINLRLFGWVAWNKHRKNDLD